MNFDGKITYHVYEGTYPFDILVGMVDVDRQEDGEAAAASALREALRVYGEHVVVSL